MPDWLLALLLTFAAMTLGAGIGIALVRAHIASDRRWRR